ncbi:TPR-like protein, partial [Lophiostoma macrostomum CBS 122681]
MVLWHPDIRNHPNILELQGICWDMPLNNESGIEATPRQLSKHTNVWPVLVFEQSHFGDMYHFAKLPIGRELGIKARLKMCLDIGNAIAHMQSRGIIHGDIKPQNVLIFRNNDGSFTARAADFGFSTMYTNYNDQIVLPESWPWYAPECHEYAEFSPQQAAKTDVFSFGLLCLWFLFENYLSGVLPLPEAARWASNSCTYESLHPSLELLESLKRQRSLARFANQLVATEAGLNIEEREKMQGFFNGCLACDPEERDIDVEHSLIHANATAFQPHSLGQTEFGIYTPVDHDFKLARSLYSFYSSDYRLRNHILESLEELVRDDPESILSTELALCYEIGFGCPDASKTTKLLTVESKTQLEDAMNARSNFTEHAGTVYSKLARMNHTLPIHLADHYLEQNVLEEAQRSTRKDVESVQHALGETHQLTFNLKNILISIMEHLGQWEDAEILQLEVLEMMKKALGQDHPDTLQNMMHLAGIYLERRHWDKAEKLQVEALNIGIETLGEDHPETLSWAAELAATYWDQGRQVDCRDLLTKTVNVKKRVLGDEHPSTLDTMKELATIHRDVTSKDGWQSAEKLHAEIVATRTRIFGSEHIDTLIGMEDLAMTYIKQKRYGEAEKTYQDALDTSLRVLGHEHPRTLANMSRMTHIYNLTGRFKMEIHMNQEILDLNRRVLGEAHPDTISSMEDVAVGLEFIGRQEEAENMFKETLAISKSTLGPDHISTALIRQTMAIIYGNQSRWQEAEELMTDVVDTRRRTDGPEHEDTLDGTQRLVEIIRKQGRWEEAE